MMRDGDGAPLRLLPWPGQRGKRLYLSTDGPDSRLARAADATEIIQLAMAAELLDHSTAMLTQYRPTTDELRHLSSCLTSSLTDVLRIAESRGGRLGDG
ncbi:hypothetical protein AB0D04_23330 [Streptomyces sp. NPDC048483]|uniref:hypothetical protein n=1 Tax=Streptomyces sp. NPDC048483 TaxID=3154927 RepID=UPI003432C2AE